VLTLASLRSPTPDAALYNASAALEQPRADAALRRPPSALLSLVAQPSWSSSRGCFRWLRSRPGRVPGVAFAGSAAALAEFR
jgi:hypothetical protein